MKKLVMLVVVLTLLMSATVAFADPSKNPNAGTAWATCEGFEGVSEVTLTGSAGHAEPGIGIVRTLYVNGVLIFDHPGQGYQTTWCQWTVEGDPTQYSGDVQLVPPGGH
jgi:hypothetical protein